MPTEKEVQEFVRSLELLMDNMQADAEGGKKLMEAINSGEIELDDEQLKRLQKYALQKRMEAMGIHDMFARERDRRAAQKKGKP